MARHLTRCLKRTYLLTNRFNVHGQSMPILKSSNFASLQKISQIHKINLDHDEPMEFSEFIKNTKSSKAIAISTIMKVLDVSKATARNTVDQYPAFNYIPGKMIEKNFHILREAGVCKSTIKDNKFLLSNLTEDLEKNIHSIRKIDIDLNDAVHLFHLSTVLIARFATRSKMEASYLPNRIRYLAEKLECNVSTMCRLVSYHPHMLLLSAPKILSITEYLLECGIAPKHIVCDLTAYKYHLSTIKEKLTRAKEVGVRPLKLWVIRCTPEVWEKLESKQIKRDTLPNPGQSIQEYLCEIFECEMEEVNYLIQRNPRVLTIGVEKIMNIAKLLRSEGYKIQHIQRAPRIMQRNYETLKELFEDWRKSGTRQPYLCKFLLDKERFNASLRAECSVKPKVKSS